MMSPNRRGPNKVIPELEIEEEMMAGSSVKDEVGGGVTEEGLKLIYYKSVFICEGNEC